VRRRGRGAGRRSREIAARQGLGKESETRQDGGEGIRQGIEADMRWKLPCLPFSNGDEDDVSGVPMM